MFIDAVLTEKREAQLNTLGRILSHLDVASDEVIINLELEVLGDSRSMAEPSSIRARFDAACELLGERYLPRFVTLRVARPGLEPTTMTCDAISSAVIAAAQELEPLKTKGQVAAVGIALHDWRLGRQLLDVTDLGFLKLLTGPTVLRHPPEMLACFTDLAARATPVITAGVFHGGFLVGGSTFDGSRVDPNSRADQARTMWRKAFTSLCHGHGVRPAHACIQFALSLPAVVAASLRTTNVDRVGEAVHAATTPVPGELWASMKEEGLLEQDYGDARSS
jgi:D-threo-aldose 1-dehydrogenase